MPKPPVLLMLSLPLFGFAFGYLFAFLHFNGLLETTRLQDLSGLQISQLKLALDGRGNLWLWHHRISSMSGLAFYYYLPIGLLLGLGAAFFWLALYKIITIGRAA